MLLLIAMACTTPAHSAPTGDPHGSWEPPGGGVVHLETRDGVTLEADYYPASAEGRPSVVLLHMVPPHNDRTTWSAAFIESLHAHDWAVLVPDRRGAGASGGVAVDAYEGPAGRYDVEACALRLRDDGYGPLAIVGASNGTTSMIDYTAFAPGEGLPVPVSHAFLTGGEYTEEQTAMEDVASTPSFLATQTSEAAWTEAQRPLDPGTWEIHEYPGAGHGTQMFDGTAELAGHLDAWLQASLTSG